MQAFQVPPNTVLGATFLQWVNAQNAALQLRLQQLNVPGIPNAVESLTEPGGTNKIKGFNYVKIFAADWALVTPILNNMVGTVPNWIPGTRVYLGFMPVTNGLVDRFPNSAPCPPNQPSNPLAWRNQLCIRCYVNNGGTVQSAEIPVPNAFCYRLIEDYTPDPDISPQTSGYSFVQDVNVASNYQIVTELSFLRAPGITMDEYCSYKEYSDYNIHQVWNSYDPDPNVNPRCLNLGLPDTMDSVVPQNAFVSVLNTYLATIQTSGSPLLPQANSFTWPGGAVGFSTEIWWNLVRRGYMYHIPDQASNPTQTARLTGKFHREAQRVLEDPGFLWLQDMECGDVNENFDAIASPRFDILPSSPIPGGLGGVNWLGFINQVDSSFNANSNKWIQFWDGFRTAIAQYLVANHLDAIQGVTIDSSRISILRPRLQFIDTLQQDQMVVTIDIRNLVSPRSAMNMRRLRATVFGNYAVNANSENPPRGPIPTRTQIYQTAARSGTLRYNPVSHCAAYDCNAPKPNYDMYFDNWGNTPAHEFGHLLGLADRYLYTGWVEKSEGTSSGEAWESHAVISPQATLTQAFNPTVVTPNQKAYCNNVPMYLPAEFDPQYAQDFRWMHNLMSSTRMVYPSFTAPQNAAFRTVAGGSPHLTSTYPDPARSVGQFQRWDLLQHPNVSYESLPYLNAFVTGGKNYRPQERLYYNNPNPTATLPPRYRQIALFISKVQLQLIQDNYTEYSFDADIWGCCHTQNNTANSDNTVLLRQIDTTPYSAMITASQPQIDYRLQPFFGTFIGLKREYEIDTQSAVWQMSRKVSMVTDDRYFEYQLDNPFDTSVDSVMENRMWIRNDETLPGGADVPRNNILIGEHTQANFDPSPGGLASDANKINQNNLEKGKFLAYFRTGSTVNQLNTVADDATLGGYLREISTYVNSLYALYPGTGTGGLQPPGTNCDDTNFATNNQKLQQLLMVLGNQNARLDIVRRGLGAILPVTPALGLAAPGGRQFVPELDLHNDDPTNVGNNVNQAALFLESDAGGQADIGVVGNVNWRVEPVWRDPAHRRRGNWAPPTGVSSPTGDLSDATNRFEALYPLFQLLGAGKQDLFACVRDWRSDHETRDWVRNTSDFLLGEGSIITTRLRGQVLDDPNGINNQNGVNNPAIPGPRHDKNRGFTIWDEYRIDASGYRLLPLPLAAPGNTYPALYACITTDLKAELFVGPSPGGIRFNGVPVRTHLRAFWEYYPNRAPILAIINMGRQSAPDPNIFPDYRPEWDACQRTWPLF